MSKKKVRYEEVLIKQEPLKDVICRECGKMLVRVAADAVEGTCWVCTQIAVGGPPERKPKETITTRKPRKKKKERGFKKNQTIDQEVLRKAEEYKRKRKAKKDARKRKGI